MAKMHGNCSDVHKLHNTEGLDLRVGVWGIPLKSFDIFTFKVTIHLCWKNRPLLHIPQNNSVAIPSFKNLYEKCKGSSNNFQRI